MRPKYALTREQTAENPAGTRILVYGTGVRGGENAWRLGNAKFLGKAQLPGFIKRDVVMMSPAIEPAPGQVVEGELYEMDPEALLAFDAYEGIDWRREVVTLADGTKAWSYVYRGNPGDGHRPGDPAVAIERLRILDRMKEGARKGLHRGMFPLGVKPARKAAELAGGLAGGPAGREAGRRAIDAAARVVGHPDALTESAIVERLPTPNNSERQRLGQAIVLAQELAEDIEAGGWTVPHPLPKNVKYLGGGSTRNVFEIAGYAVKIPVHEADRDMNVAEEEAWDNAPAELRRYLVPVLSADPGGNWLIMPIVEYVNPSDADRFCALLRANGFESDISDCWYENVGRLESEVRLLDYPDWVDLVRNYEPRDVVERCPYVPGESVADYQKRDHAELGYLLGQTRHELDEYATTEDEDDLEQARKAFRAFVVDLMQHVVSEEDDIFPTWLKTHPKDRVLIDQLLAEHVEIKKRVKAVEKALKRADAEEGIEAIDPLFDLVKAHDALEEKRVFTPKREQGVVERLSIGGDTVCPPTGDDFATAETFRPGRPNMEQLDARKVTKRKLAGWRKASEAAKKLLLRHGVSLDELLGCGSFACAWSVEGRPDLVVKITGDPSEAAAWESVIAFDEDERPAALARTFCVEAFPGVVPGKSGHRLYFILQERLRSLDGREKRLINTVSYELRKLGGEPGWQGHQVYSTERAAVVLDDIKTAVRHKFGDSAAEALGGLVEALAWLRDVAGVDFRDLHGGNVLVADVEGVGRYRIGDLGFSSSSDVDVAMIEP